MAAHASVTDNDDAHCPLCEMGHVPEDGEHRLPTWEPVICARSEVVVMWLLP